MFFHNMAHTQALSATTILILYLTFLSLIHFTSSKSIGFSLKLIPRDSPESPLYFGNVSESEKLHRFVQISKARAYNLRPNDLRLHVSLDDLWYVVKIHIGSPSTPVFLAMDTRNGLTWTQCKPCVNCYRQITPIYDSTASHTYRQIPCNHPVCLSNQKLFRCFNQRCIYSQFYLGGMSTKGNVSLETFGFLNNISVSLIFGCSNDNLAAPFAHEGKISGVLGLSLAPESLTQVLGDVINHRFSYCLVPFNQASMATSFLRFGNDIDTRGRHFKSTPILSSSHYLYYLNLIDISINGQRMGFPPGTFALKRDGSGGCIIDTGSPATFLHHIAYGPVMRTFVNYFAHFGLKRHNATYKHLDLCYEYDINFHAYASVTFHFQGADLTIEPQYFYAFHQEDGLFCIPLLPDEKTILGALHQQNNRFIYDIKNGILLFASEDCLLDTQ